MEKRLSFLSYVCVCVYACVCYACMHVCICVCVYVYGVVARIRVHVHTFCCGRASQIDSSSHLLPDPSCSLSLPSPFSLTIHSRLHRPLPLTAPPSLGCGPSLDMASRSRSRTFSGRCVRLLSVARAGLFARLAPAWTGVPPRSPPMRRLR